MNDRNSRGFSTDRTLFCSLKCNRPRVIRLHIFTDELFYVSRSGRKTFRLGMGCSCDDSVSDTSNTARRRAAARGSSAMQATGKLPMAYPTYERLLVHIVQSTSKTYSNAEDYCTFKLNVIKSLEDVRTRNLWHPDLCFV